MSRHRLFVSHQGRRVGILEERPGGSMELAYDAEWLARRDRFPISVRLPLGAAAFGSPAHAFFANLLPEGELRRLLCRRLGISPDNDFALLEAIGGECAGALSLSPEEPSGAAQKPDYRPISLRELEKLASESVLPSIDGRAGLRLSMAGAQDKLPVRLEGDRILLPLGASASTHLLKFPNQHYKHLPANEVLITEVARQLKLPVVDAELRSFKSQGMCVVPRYDRIVDPGGSVARLHQEDLCQALGKPPSNKYEKEGGPTFVQCLECVRSVSADPLADTRQLIRWMAFCILALNSDGHAKNVSILYRAGEARLAPFYDLLCTRAYPRLARELAMAVGEETEPTQVRRSHWERLAESAGLGARFVIDTVRPLAAEIPDAVSTSAKIFRERYGESPILQLVVPKLRRQGRRIEKLLA